MTTSQNPYEVFDLPPTFDVDERALQRRYVQLSAATHPDRFPDPVEQAEAAERSAAINQAHRQLRDPEQRARVLLELMGSAEPDDNSKLPPDVLMELMEVREALEEARSRGDEAAIARTVRDARADRKQHLERVGQLFAEAQTASEDTRADLLAQVRDELNALRYVQRLLEQAHQ